MPNSKYRSYFTPLLLFFASFILRLSLISKGPYHLDCLNLIIQSEKTLDTLTLHSLFGFGYPLTVILGSIFIFIFNIFTDFESVFAINFMSVFFSSLCIPIFYLLTIKLFDRKVALLSSIMLSITPIFLGVSVYGKSHTPSLFFLLLGINHLLAYCKTNHKKHLFISSLYIGLLGACRLQDMIIMIFPIICLLLFGIGGPPHTRKSSLQPNKTIITSIINYWLIAIIIAGIFHLPYFFQKEQQAFYAQQFFGFWQQGVTYNFKGVLSISLVVSFIFLMKTFTEIGFAAALIGLLYIAHKYTRVFIFLILWICIPFLFYGNLHTTVPRFLTIILPPLILAQSYVFVRLISINRAFRSITLIIYGTILSLIFMSIFPNLNFRHKNALIPSYVKWVAENVENNAHIMTIDDALFFNYYGKLRTIARPGDFLNINDNDISTFQHKLDDLLENNIPIYTTFSGLYAYDPDLKFSQFIEKHYELEILGTHLYEDWHRGSLTHRVFYNYLIRIKKKSISKEKALNI